MSYQTIHCAISDRVATITLARPPANVLSRRTVQELDHAFGNLQNDEAVRCIVVTGAGRLFCGGADIHELASITTVPEGTACAREGQRLMHRIERSETPVMAAINGACVGGGLELAMACHVRVAAEGSLFGLPEVKLGLIPGFGGTQRLPRIIGSAKASELILTGALIPAEMAEKWGLVNGVVASDDLLPEVQRMAGAVATLGQMAVRAALEAIRAGIDCPSKEGMACEAEWFGRLCETPDKKEGIQAFLEHRPPKFGDL